MFDTTDRVTYTAALAAAVDVLTHDFRRCLDGCTQPVCAFCGRAEASPTHRTVNVITADLERDRPVVRFAADFGRPSEDDDEGK